jgi:hypothetical protein
VIRIDDSDSDPKVEFADPYRRLWASVIWIAVRDMNKKGSHRAATHWMFSHQKHVGSVRWICDMLDIDCNALQQLVTTREGRSKILRSRNDRD